MGRIIRNQVIAGTGLDRHAERLSESEITDLFEQISPDTPTGVNHDLSQSPIIRLVNKRLVRAANGDLNIAIDFEVLDEAAFLRMGGFSIGFSRRTWRIGKGLPVAEVVLNCRQFDVAEVAAELAHEVPDNVTIDVIEKVEKSERLTTAVITFVLTGTAGKLLSTILDPVFDRLKALLRRDEPGGPKTAQFMYPISMGARTFYVHLLPTEGTNWGACGAVDFGAVTRTVEVLDNVAGIDRVIGRFDADGAVQLDAVVRKTGTQALGLTIRPLSEEAQRDSDGEGGR